MSSIVNADALTLNAREADTVSKVIFERVFNQSDLSEYHDVETGVDMKTQIAFAGRIGLLGKASAGCAPNEAAGLTFTEKFWDPAVEDFRLKHCQGDMPKLLKLFKSAKKMNPDFYDVVGSPEFGVVIAAVEDGMKENIHRKIWFNDLTAATTANGGSFKVGTDLGYWNTFNGLFKQIFTEVPTTAPNYVAISANTGNSYVNQALAADAALTILGSMYAAADSRLLQDPNAFFLVTRSIADNYRATLRNKNLGAGFLEVVEGGRTKLTFEGKEVKTRYDWDMYIQGYQNNGTKYNLPHRAVFTTKSNIPVGTLSEEDLQKLDVFYDKTLKTNIIDGVYTLDAKHLEKYMTVAAY
ncbi:hypothetical protein Q765_03300 [Flavobacterium rivuli WB 3.3-2 = DSM 21788]|uniref:Phage capsid protein n=1 Tax=Flavobacterium rivuli WB 3.3-2 = DSM 21788 TaxID=1121895 RepID=A0A0A2M738_9FLAO|nr:hypothetical protein [Flavobacterium rivuli]KGO88094.1 hypothetical protein Q765_03300 [Flavobacterium rivuli WB 3.3-2 = DSM 21788]